MKIQSKNPSTIAHGKANLPEVGIVELSKDGTVEVPDAIAEELLTNSPDSWGLEGGENPFAPIVGAEAKEVNLQENIINPDTIVAKYDDVTLDEEDLENNPLLRAFGLKVGDEIGVPAGSEYSPEFSDEDEEEIADEQEQGDGAGDNPDGTEKGSETQEKQETEDEKALRLEAEAAEENELKKSLLKKGKEDLLNMAAAMEIPQAEYQDLNKKDLVNLLIKATKDAE